MIIATIVSHNASLPMGYVKSLLSVREYIHLFQEGSSIADNRNKVFERARIENDSLLFIDSDMQFTRDDVKRIEEDLKTKDVVTGVCVMGFPGFPPALFKLENESYRITKPQNEIFEVDACGAAFLGISSQVIKTLTEPFTPVFDEKWGQSFGEDVSFCINARREGFKVWCDPLLHIGHIKTEAKYYTYE